MIASVHDSEELAFARAMLAEPHQSLHRLAYADWLEERGDAERAALVREAEGWRPHLRGKVPHRDLLLLDYRERWRLVLSPLRAGTRTGWAEDVVAYVSLYPVDGRPPGVWYVRPDGSSWGPHNWAWLLSLAMARGLKIPGLYAPVPADPELET